MNAMRQLQHGMTISDSTGERVGTPGSDPATTVITAVLTLASAGGLLCCLGYAVWWLLTTWAPF